MRDELASDNTAGICSEAVAALEEANRGTAPAYGDDEWTRRLRERVSELFEIECAVFLAFNGTAANALALAQLCQPFHSVICHEYAHIETDECGAVEFFTRGSKLIPIRGANGKVDLQELEIVLSSERGVHSHKPGAISITQATELGTIYTPEEVRRVCEFARRHHMSVHMDGARFANAVVAHGCAPKEVTWQAGLDVLCFGGTKNGLSAAELIIFFDKKRSADFDYRLKQAGQLASKMRFLAAPWVGLLESGAWLTNAHRSNETAKQLAAALGDCGAEIVFSVEANAVFLRIGATMIRHLRERGWDFYKFIEPDIYRLMCAWCTREETLTAFVADFKAGCAQAAA
jgi:threonine aldolase